jgi:hypothetical protein
MEMFDGKEVKQECLRLLEVTGMSEKNINPY